MTKGECGLSYNAFITLKNTFLLMKELLVYLYENCAISDVSIITLFVDEEKDFRIKTFAESTAPISTIDGFRLIPDSAVATIESSEHYIGLLIPGGDIRTISTSLQTLILDFEKAQKLIGAFCAGPTFLALAGILTDHQYTTSMTPERYRKKKIHDPFPWDNFLEARYVVHRNIITAKGVAILEFADQFLSALGLFAEDGTPGYTQKAFRIAYAPKW